MTVVIDKKLTRQAVKALVEKVKNKPKVFDAKKYFGKYKIEGDALEIQKEMRDE